MNLNKLQALLILVFALALPGCGGGGGIAYSGSGGGSSGGIGGTGVTSTGTIDGFGSIFVNGVEFETDESDVFLNGASSTVSDLRLGMVVTVRGTVNEDGATGSANQVIFHSELIGPVSEIEIDQNHDSLVLTVLGVRVITERTATVLDGVSFDTLAVNDLIDVSGFFESSKQIRATNIQKSSTFVAGVSDVKLEGIVSALSNSQFSLGTVFVDYSNADLSGVPEGKITEGLLVEAYGTLTGNVITANRVEVDEELRHGFDEGSDVTVMGAITGLVDLSQFVVNGVIVDASNAELEPHALVLANGMIVEVEGIWNGSKLNAKAVKSRRGRVELQARVASVDTSGRSITVQYATGTVTVAVSSTTLLKDNTDQSTSLSLGTITSGNFLQIEASQLGDTLLASRIQRDSADSDVLQAPVERFTRGVDMTLLGVTFSTDGAKFKDSKNTAVGANAFFGQLQIGDLVKLTDEDVPDGTADEIEIERERTPLE